ncbi:hypothetical protein N9X48_08720, partial [Luminiphilus sp.]|nr:hypothetical protein [Luminiphilus sp.]
SAGVATASSVQVREPAHTRSIGRWRRYETELARQSEVDAEFGEKARTIYQALQKRGFGRSDFSIVLKSVLNSLD